MPGVPVVDGEVVYLYLTHVYNELNRPVTARMLAKAMDKDDSGSSSFYDIQGSLDSLYERHLIRKGRIGYEPLDLSSALRRQLLMDEVEPFVREYGETAEAHVDKVWDFRTPLIKPAAGGIWGLGPVGHLILYDRLWKGLTLDLPDHEDDLDQY